MNYTFLPSLLVRTPGYSYRGYQHADYEQLLKDPGFQVALFLASRPFFEEIAKKNFEFAGLNEKQRSTIIKYFNRASFRSTPFGLFSSFSLIDWGASASPVTLSSSLTHYTRPDFFLLVQLAQALIDEPAAEGLLFYPNQSIYQSKTDIRYIKADIDENQQSHFSMVSISSNRVLKKLLGFCASGRTLKDIRQFLTRETGATGTVAGEFIRELYEQDVLVPSLRPGVTGNDAGLSVIAWLRQRESVAFSQLADPLQALYDQPSVGIEQLLSTSRRLDALAGNKTAKSFFYTIAERKVTAGALPARLQQQVQEGLYCLSLLSRPFVPEDLRKFKKAFIDRYECGEFPLLEIIDPQLGIGYGDFDALYDELGLQDMASPAMANPSSSGGAVDRQDLPSLLLDEWLRNGSPDQEKEIVITDKHLASIKRSPADAKYPPSISVMFRTLEHQVFIENAGGCSALSLLGRFSCSPQVAAFARSIARQEQAGNKGIVFAEIAHVCNVHAANINRRAHLRDYEIPVLASSSLDSKHQIHLSDLMVSVQNDTVVLRSARLNKMIIPRLASAYNYTRNAYPVFRFLCDVQSQHLMADLTFSMAALMPGRKFYPRVRYRSAILQLAEWHFRASDLSAIYTGHPAGQLVRFRSFAHHHKLPRHIAYAYSDNFIVFDLDNEGDILFLLRETRNKKDILIREFPFTGAGSHVYDHAGKPLLAQYTAALQLNGPTYSQEGSYSGETKESKALRDTSGWLYFKIYCHLVSADIILTEHLLPVLQESYHRKNIRDWFWVRYNDPDHHLRLRLKPAAGQYGKMFQALHAVLSRLFASRLVHRFHTDMYKRETDRYSPALMLQAEAVFGASSRLIGAFLKQRLPGEPGRQLLTEAVIAVREHLESFSFPASLQLDFCQAQFRMFFDEFGRPRNLKPAIEKLHKSIGPEASRLFAARDHQVPYNELRREIRLLASAFYTREVKTITRKKLAADIIHMHLNRLFFSKQRYHEMITYYLVIRCLSMEKHCQPLEVLPA